ncbi:hypothetical protein C4573_04085 [Candidatus Woesearchaeota archaeon]|nr:MAG: hypothetical protein C4573_04085 [Candidatus Woesearchaeota archaeon]
MDISNKTLALFLVAAIIVSIAGTFISLQKIGKFEQASITGYATNYTGNVTLEISKNASLIFTISSINWGTGSVAGGSYCELWTNGSGFNSAGCIGFSTIPSTSSLVIENDGQVHLNVTMNSSVNETGFFGSYIAAHKLQWQVLENETNSCFGGTVSPSAFTNVSVASMASAAIVCDYLNFTDSKDSLLVNVFVNFTDLTSQGQKNATFIALGTQIGT